MQLEISVWKHCLPEVDVLGISSTKAIQQYSGNLPSKNSEKGSWFICEFKIKWLLIPSCFLTYVSITEYFVLCGVIDTCSIGVFQFEDFLGVRETMWVFEEGYFMLRNDNLYKLWVTTTYTHPTLEKNSWNENFHHVLINWFHIDIITH